MTEGIPLFPPSSQQSSDNENMTNQITMEEHFVQPEQAKKDPNAVYIEDNPQKALEKLRTLANNENFREKYKYQPLLCFQPLEFNMSSI